MNLTRVITDAAVLGLSDIKLDKCISFIQQTGDYNGPRNSRYYWPRALI